MDSSTTMKEVTVEGEGNTRKRVFLGGLSQLVGEADLVDRFQSFGTVSNIRLPLDPFSSDNHHRGFAHFDLEVTDEKWKRLTSAYNGSMWRGSKLCIETARPDYTERYQKESIVSKPVKRVRKIMRLLTDQRPMRDSLVNKRPGWKKSKYGRAVAMLKMRRADGKFITVDPSHYKHCIEKLFGSVKPLPITKLTWSIENYRGNMDIVQSDDDSCISEYAIDQDDFIRKDEFIDVEVEEELKTDESERTVESTENMIESTDKIIEPVNESSEEEIESNHKAMEPMVVEESKHQTAVVAEEGFSLSKLLGLAIPEVIKPKPDATPQTTALPIILKPSEPVNVSTLLFDFTKLASLKDIAFCRRCGKDEAYVMWQERRPELRHDFRQRMKQAKKLARRRPTNPKSS